MTLVVILKAIFYSVLVVLALLIVALLILLLIGTIHDVRIDLIKSRKEMDEIRARRRNRQ